MPFKTLGQACRQHVLYRYVHMMLGGGVKQAGMVPEDVWSTAGACRHGSTQFCSHPAHVLQAVGRTVHTQ